jgi:hypothetical protein
VKKITKIQKKFPKNSWWDFSRMFYDGYTQNNCPNRMQKTARRYDFRWPRSKRVKLHEKTRKNPKNRPSTPRNIFAQRTREMKFGTIAWTAGTHILSRGISVSASGDRAGGRKVRFWPFLTLWGPPKNFPPGVGAPYCKRQRFSPTWIEW